VPDIPEDPRQIAGTPVRVQDLDGGYVGRLLVGLDHGRVGEAERDSRRRRHLARDAHDREEVRAIGRDLDVEDGVLELERGLQVLPGREVLGQHEDSVVVRRDPELHGRAEHAVGDHAPDPPGGERLGNAGDGGAGAGERYQIARPHVSNADDDLALRHAGRYSREAQSGGLRVGVVAHLEDPGHDHARQPLPGALDALDLGALGGQQLRELLRSEIHWAELAEPGERNPHAAPWNCSRNRTSPSTNSRMSLTPYRTMATRSMPIPNANPVYRSESTPQFSSTRGWTMPAPNSSIHPLPHVAHPAPSQTKHETATWAPGSTNGK